MERRPGYVRKHPSFMEATVSVSICSGCDKRSWVAGWLINDRNIFLSLVEAGKFKIKVLADSESGEDWLPDSDTGSSHWWKGRGNSLRLVSQSPSGGLCPHDLITSQRPNILIPSLWGWGFNIWTVRRHKQTTAVRKIARLLKVPQSHSLPLWDLMDDGCVASIIASLWTCFVSLSRLSCACGGKWMPWFCLSGLSPLRPPGAPLSQLQL